MPNAPVTRSSSDAASQAEILSLLRKLSEDNDKLHNELAHLRRDHSRTKASLEDRVNGSVGELKAFVSRKIDDHLLTMNQSLKRYVRDPITQKIDRSASDIEDTVSTAISDGFEDMEENLGDAVSTAISDGFEGMEENLGDAVCTAVLDGVHGGLADNIRDTVVEGLDEIVGEAVSTAMVDSIEDSLADKLEDLGSDLREKLGKISDGISKQGKILRSDMAVVHHELSASKGVSYTPGNQDGFILFSRLPPELRLAIWKIACFNNPSVIKMHAKCHNDILQGFECSGYRVPAVLQTSREPRQEALKWYHKRSVEIEETWSPAKSMQLNSKYFNFDVDIFYLAIDDTWSSDVSPSWAELINSDPVYREFRRIAVSDSLFDMIDLDDELHLLTKPYSQIEDVLLVANSDRLSGAKQQLVPAHIVTDNFIEGEYVFDGNHIPIDEYSLQASYLAFKAKLFLDIMVDEADKRYTVSDLENLLSNYREQSVPTGNALAAVESANPHLAALADNPLLLDEAARNTRRAEIQKFLCPNFTVMALQDVCPISNAGLVLG